MGYDGMQAVNSGKTLIEMVISWQFHHFVWGFCGDVDLQTNNHESKSDLYCSKNCSLQPCQRLLESECSKPHRQKHDPKNWDTFNEQSPRQRSR
jgi:hypothetical protein